jgi:Flp pilus assembly protein TadG
MTMGHTRRAWRVGGAVEGFCALIEDRRGGALVETALILPVLLTLIFGVIDTGLLLWTQVSLNYAVGAAARCAAINNNLCSPASSGAAIKTYALQQAAGIPSLTTSNFTVVLPGASAICGNTNTQVSATYNFTSMAQAWVPYSLTLNATACYKTS